MGTRPLPMLFFLFLTTATACTTTPRDRLDAYLEAINRHDVEGALSQLAEDFRLVFADAALTMTKAQLREALTWDVGVNGRVTYDVLSADADSIVIFLTERNDFLALLGIEQLQSRNTFFLDENGLLRKQHTDPLPDQPSYQEAMQPGLEWAALHRPDELAAIYPDGQMIYNEAMARRWVALLREWKEATASVE